MDQQIYFPKENLQKLAVELVHLVYEDKKEKEAELLSMLEDSSVTKETLLFVIENLMSAIELQKINNEYVRIYQDMIRVLSTAGDDEDVVKVRANLKSKVSTS
ncbi:hypothetical protein A2781_07400 [Candidatus Gottesmanbacteria bacterium RIFCSPHIGHO2_01_FULL_42_27]|uniref:Uncharacterized protein n=1 Tax=Candidatus Gottesmanbacteria bacterium RIFCSPLOWO2_01_FULL_42_22 TaxID=1798391 RepID=A0A1F6BJV6_9BACT|nr:MAG: hypothetical protein A2781_07400 [Candidatus Gottesmanbacteria bacterium RIFCSPHIGHO2_01_FULL_42_27]OGG33314.1 MAG: hypothetical protein A3G68_06665 [Candidatus Gottesmanbacteria bacterium RIFCSPLOWO2_12_FULL_42_10]OGG37209.1 MAG: hypothetical protein A2968_05240 [Candidatus Gottesmanbacteria bacterium RIFCSPLOWO2_01_FULL_42_22]